MQERSCNESRNVHSGHFTHEFTPPMEVFIRSITQLARLSPSPTRPSSTPVHPSIPDDAPGLDYDLSNRMTREGDPATLLVDIDERDAQPPDAIVDLTSPRELPTKSVPDSCNDGSGRPDIESPCREGVPGADRYLNRTLTTSTDPSSHTDRLPAAAVVTTDHGAMRVHPGGVSVRVSAPPGVCDPRGISNSGSAIAAGDPVSADGGISGLATSGPAESVTITIPISAGTQSFERWHRSTVTSPLSGSSPEHIARPSTTEHW